MNEKKPLTEATNATERFKDARPAGEVFKCSLDRERSEAARLKGEVFKCSLDRERKSSGRKGWFEDPLVKGKGGPDSGTEPYDARVSRTVPLRRV